MNTENQLKNTKKLTFKSLTDLRIVFLTFFGTGLAPKAPGTVGSLATIIPLYFVGKLNAPFFFFIPFLILLTIGAVFITSVIEKEYDCIDPSWIVIDEVIGIWIASLFILEPTFVSYAFIFIFFRIFDIWKPWPVRVFDDRKDALGTILDDVAAGLMAGILYILTFKLLEIYA
ncbi:phosphatidylglycerophosphatase A [Halobacteriovorax sp. BALOs_7]|uniref:phosphatidylglycerophosphatase A family protein n=1 Tax=unclassified Halobacteriovorax TaxID=2639665 RepID=UPI000EA2E404|nr:phosphatidylglycerophosphatase A [Halobacteriovorax sp. BALOs_7]AYF43195.1 phosphatidylglycerophosphatase A [Halobacteriovorax sp. BALOs_7]